MKKMKFRKLSRVLISISLLAIIAVSLISVPVSAAYDQNDLLGTWVLNDTLERVDANIWIPSIDGVGHWVTSDGTIEEFHIMRIRIYSSNFSFYIEGDENSVYPSISCVDNKVTIYPIDYPQEFDYYDIRVGEVGYTEARTFTINAINNEGDAEAMLAYLQRNATKVVPPEPTLLDNILGTFSEVGSWIGTIISSLVALFWSVETASLTFLGILSVAGLAFSVIMLLFGFVSRFVGFSG